MGVYVNILWSDVPMCWLPIRQMFQRSTQIIKDEPDELFVELVDLLSFLMDQLSKCHASPLEINRINIVGGAHHILVACQLSRIQYVAIGLSAPFEQFLKLRQLSYFVNIDVFFE